MKKIVLTLALAILSTIGAMAQDSQQSDKKRPSKAEMIERRTNHMVERYNLDETQKAKLQELNAKYADMLAPMHRGDKRMHPRGLRPELKGDKKQFGQKGEMKHFVQKGDSMPVAKADDEQKKPLRRDGGKHHKNMDKLRKQMESYDNELKTIMTEQQYSAYRNDREKMMKRDRKK